MATVYKVCNIPLPISEVIKVFQDPPEEALSTLPPVKPKAGDIYIYKPADECQQKDQQWAIKCRLM